MTFNTCGSFTTELCNLQLIMKRPLVSVYELLQFSNKKDDSVIRFSTYRLTDTQTRRRLLRSCRPLRKYTTPYTSAIYYPEREKRRKNYTKGKYLKRKIIFYSYYYYHVSNNYQWRDIIFNFSLGIKITGYWKN